MLSKLDNWSNRIIQGLNDRPELVKIYIIPILLFLVDFVLRAVVGVDLIDAGADMAFVAVATFLSVIIEDIENNHARPVVVLPIFLAFMLPWFFCLWSVSNQNNVFINLLGYSINAQIILSILSWSVGLITLIISGSMIHRLSQRTPVV